MKRVVVVLPALDEEASIGAVVTAVPRGLASVVIVVDNGSVDRTTARARAAGARVVSEPRKGYGRACLTGIEAALDAGAEVIVLLDADGSDAPEELARLLAPLDLGADLALGVRAPARTEEGAMTLQQRFGNALAVWLMRVWVGASYADLPPFKAVRADALGRLALSDEGYGFTIELLLRAHEQDLRVVEVPMPCRRRSGGASKVSGTLRGTIGAGVKILSAIARHRRRS